MKAFRPLTLACGLALAGLAGCGKTENAPVVAPSKPLPAGIEVAIQRHAFDAGGPLRPYEPAMLVVSGPEIQNHPRDEHLWLDSDSRLNGQPIPEDLIRHLQFGGAEGPEKDQRRLTLAPAIQPWALLPRRPGEVTFDLIVHAGREKWICPPFGLRITATEVELQQVADLEETGASQFLNHPVGARRTREPDAPPLPYETLTDFMARHPQSYLADVIRDRARRLFLLDVNSCSPEGAGPLLADDRAALAAVLGRFDPRFPEHAAEVQAQYEKHRDPSKPSKQVEEQVAVAGEWHRLAESAAGAP
jgi:hypothetical protein